MVVPAFPSDESERVEALHASGLLDTPTEERFDRITRLAQRFFNVPIAIISLVDRDRQWFKSRQGLDVCETDREISFCGHAILGSEVFVIPDATRDERFRDNPLVTDEPHIRFYAGYPISTAEGSRIGTICIIDHVPRNLDENQLQLLKDLAKLVEREVSVSSPPGDEMSLVKGIGRQSPGFGVPRRGWLAHIVSGLGSRMGASICALIAAGLVIGISLRWDHHKLVAHRTEVQAKTLDQLTALRGRLESTLNSKLHLVYGLSGFVNARGQVDEPAFQRFAPRLKGALEGVASLQLAPNGVVTHIWPLAGNEAARGHDLFADPKRREAALRAINERRFVVAGPVELRQGGTALIGRLPIFLRDSSGEENFWGFSIVLVNFSTLMKESGIETKRNETLSLAIRGKHGLGKDGEPFFGDSSLFDQSSVKSDVVLPNGTWQLAAMPAGGWPTTWPGRKELATFSVLFALMACGLIYFFLRFPSRLSRAVRVATRALEFSQARFRDAIEALPDGFVIFDSDDRLVLCNETYRRFYKTSLPVIE
ncbi:MAG: CHASE domain-containing protein, partial [Deltaproteobacteria bacterium]|nr:CHASE domain-containing protein [Deltaproteobacteria bacterium]